MKVKDGLSLSTVMKQNIVVDLTGSFTGSIKLNSTAAEIWRGVAAGEDASRIAERLIGRYHVDREKVLSDVEHFIQEMVEQGFFVQ